MYATLIICEDESGVFPDVIHNTHSLITRGQTDQLASQMHWHMTASNLSAGKLIDLLLYMDKLGFQDRDSQ